MSGDPKILNLSQLMQPELLTADQLRNVLISRCIRVDNMQDMKKNKLLELFHRIATPLQQRVRFENRKSENISGKTNKEATKCNSRETEKAQNAKETLETANEVKRMKISHEKSENAHCNKVHIKRSYNYDCKSSIESEAPSQKKIRQRIQWP